MRNKLLAFIREYDLINPGDTVICAVSGGADSMALLWSMYLLKEKLGIALQAAHFNHNLRGEESLRDEAFVVSFCKAHDILCHVGSGIVKPGEKGLEAAARNARYAFLEALSGKIATAHTADDNAETLLMHLVRGTGLKGLGGIAPKREHLIRPMLTVTRQEVLAFLEKEKIPYVTDSSNETDAFLRNRIRHHVMPLLKAENPSLAQSLSATALGLRQDAQVLAEQAEATEDIWRLRAMAPALRTASLGKVLVNYGVKEPERVHIRQLQQIVMSENPSAYGEFPGGILIGREYGRLVRLEALPNLETHKLQCPGETEISELGIKVICRKPAENASGYLVNTAGNLVLRSRAEGDRMQLPGGSTSLKKLFITKKIPQSQRKRIPVIADNAGVVLVAGIGVNKTRQENPNWEIQIKSL